MRRRSTAATRKSPPSFGTACCCCPPLLTARCVKYADAHLPPAISGERAAANLIRGLRAAEDPLADGLHAFHAPHLDDAAAAVVRTYEDLGV